VLKKSENDQRKNEVERIEDYEARIEEVSKGMARGAALWMVPHWGSCDVLFRLQ